MSVITLEADGTTLILNGQALPDFIEGDTLELAPVNPVTEQTNGSNGGVAIQGRVDANVQDLTVRFLKYSNSDIFMNNIINQASPVVLNGSAKENFVKDGVSSVGSYLLESGSVTTRPTDTKNNQEGNSVMAYTIRFRNAVRSI